MRYGMPAPGLRAVRDRRAHRVGDCPDRHALQLRQNIAPEIHAVETAVVTPYHDGFALLRGGGGAPAMGLNERWSLDFVHDTLQSGRRIRTLNIVDDFTRECLAIEVDTSLSGNRVARVLDAIASVRGLPQTIVMDNGTELTSIAMACWARDRRVRLHFIQPGKPTHPAKRGITLGCTSARQLPPA